MNQLVMHGASIDAQNKLGETVWHYAIRQDEDTLLKAIAGLYRKSKVSDPGTRTIKFAAGRNPLQVRVTMMHVVTFGIAYLSSLVCPPVMDNSPTRRFAARLFADTAFRLAALR